MSVIEARNVVKCFDELTAVNSVSFTVEQGEFFGLLGPNGAGITPMFLFSGTFFPIKGIPDWAGI
jgi:ABC-type multidrug transport system ATPase subunit